MAAIVENLDNEQKKNNKDQRAERRNRGRGFGGLSNGVIYSLGGHGL